MKLHEKIGNFISGGKLVLWRDSNSRTLKAYLQCEEELAAEKRKADEYFRNGLHQERLANNRAKTIEELRNECDFYADALAEIANCTRADSTNGTNRKVHRIASKALEK